MSSVAFRTIETSGAHSRSEQLFRAAISAYSSLTRPSKAETAQFRELALALFDKVPDDTKRFAAAALSDSNAAPAELILRLANEPAETSAPVLARSPLLRPGDFVQLVEKHGAAHARALSRRQDIDPAIKALLELIVDRSLRTRELGTDEDAVDTSVPRPGAAAEAVRERLRAAVAGDAGREPAKRPSVTAPRGVLIARLRSTALSGEPALFQTALADALGTDYAAAGRIIGSPGYSGLLTALRGLGMRTESAFLVVAAVYPDQFASTEAIRLFVERYNLITVDAALDRIEDWVAQAAVETAGNSHANDAGKDARRGGRGPMLRAS